MERWRQRSEQREDENGDGWWEKKTLTGKNIERWKQTKTKREDVNSHGI